MKVRVGTIAVVCIKQTQVMQEGGFILPAFTCNWNIGFSWTVPLTSHSCSNSHTTNLFEQYYHSVGNHLLSCCPNPWPHIGRKARGAHPFWADRLGAQSHWTRRAFPPEVNQHRSRRWRGQSFHELWLPEHSFSEEGKEKQYENARNGMA